MGWITLTDDRAGLDDFPPEYTPVGRDALGDPLAVDRKGRVFAFQHGAGDWSRRSRAFASLPALARYVAQQSLLAIPEELNLDSLQQRKLELAAFQRELVGSPYAGEAIRAALADVRERIADLRWRTSKRGRSIQERQELGRRCEEALREAGATGGWMIRAHVDKPRALCVIGTFAAPWDEPRVLALLRPIAGEYELLCSRQPGATDGG